MALADIYAPDYRKMYESALGTVQNQYQQQRDNLTQQQSALPYQYQAQRNQVAAQSAQTGRAMDETNAQRGLYNSGIARTDLARNLATRDQGINDINNQQSQAVQSLRNQLNQLGTQEATAIAGIQGQEGQDTRNYQLQMGQLMGNVNGVPTLAADQYQQGLNSQKFNNQLALLGSLLGFNIDKAQVTDNYDAINGFNYGDYMKQLLAASGSSLGLTG